jgi:hypothetical protein
MKKLLLTASILSVSLIAGCSAMVDKTTFVKSRAAFDLDCQSVNVMEIGNLVYGATGCGRKAAYIVDCKTSFAETCKAIMNSSNGNEFK